MTRILLDLRRDIIGGTEAIPATLTARRTRVRRNGAVVTYPADLLIALPGLIDLDPPPFGEAWVLQIFWPGRPETISRTVTFTGTEVTWAALTDVDPATLLPAPVQPPAAWDAALAELTETIDTRLHALETITASAGYVHQQSSPSAQWTVVHGLGRRPSVTLYAADGTLILADVAADAGQAVITFANPTAGSAVLT